MLSSVVPALLPSDPVLAGSVAAPSGLPLEVKRGAAVVIVHATHDEYSRVGIVLGEDESSDSHWQVQVLGEGHSSARLVRLIAIIVTSTYILLC